MNDIDPKNAKVFTPIKMGNIEIRNRVIRSAAFEGMCPDGQPSDVLIEYHKKVSAGGVGMTTVAYVSVSPEGRTYAHQMWMRKEIMPRLKILTDTIHSQGAGAAVQLGHCGYFASMPVTGARPIGPSVVFNTYGLTFPKKMDENDINRIIDDFGTAAALSIEAGFDAVEVQASHGYLISQFLSPFTNRRTDKWGGSIENRMRLLLAVVRKVRQAIGPNKAMLVKLNLSDGFEGGLLLNDAVEIAKGLEKEGGVDALVLSGGFVSKVPMYIMRGDVPFKEMYEGQTSLTKKIGLLLIGRIMIKSFPFEEAYFLNDARSILKAVKIPLVLLGGLRTLSKMEEVISEGFQFVSMARPLIMEPDLINKMAKGETKSSACEPCNKCIAAMDKNGMECVLLEEKKKQI